MSNDTKIKTHLAAVSTVSFRVSMVWGLFLCGTLLPAGAGCNPQGGGTGGDDGAVLPNDPCANPGPAISLGVVDGTQGSVTLPFRAAVGKYCVQVKSGPAGYDRASAATVAINGNELARERDFNQNVDSVFSELDLAGESNAFDVHVKSGPKSQKACSSAGNGKGNQPGANNAPCEKVHAVEILLAPAMVPGAEDTQLHAIAPSGGDFEQEGWSFHFDPGAVAQPTVFNVSCEPVIAGLGPSCEIEPHTEFSFGSVVMTMPIDKSGLPEQTKPSDIFAFRNGQDVPSYADLTTKTLTVFPKSFSAWVPTVKLWLGAASPPLNEIEPKTVPTANGSYSDEYGIGIGMTSSAIVQVVPGYIDSKDHSKGFKKGWQTTGKVSLCRKQPGQPAYTEVATGDYVKGHQRVLFGPGVIAMGKNYFFAVFQEGNTAPGCATKYPSLPGYRSADLTFTRLDPDSQEGGPCTCINSASTVDYWRHNAIVDMIHEQMTTNEISEEVFRIRGWLEYNSAGTIAVANAAWLALVAETHVWDHKQYIKNKGDDGTRVYPFLKLNNASDQTCWKYFYPFPDQAFELDHDFWSNLHYGYVGGAAGFDKNWLLAAAAALSGSDQIDDTATLMGYALWKNHGNANGGTLTKQDIESTIALNFSNLVAIVNSPDYLDNQKAHDEKWGVPGGVCPGTIFQQIIPLDDGM